MAAQLWTLVSIPGVTSIVSSGTKQKVPAGYPGGRSLPEGSTALWSIFSQKGGSGVSISTSDVICVAMVPENSTILDGYICGKCNVGTGTQFKVGVGAAGLPSVTGASTDADLLGATTFSSTRVFARFSGTAAGLPYVLPAIAAATYPKYYPINITVNGGSSTVSVSIGFYISFNTAGQ